MANVKENFFRASPETLFLLLGIIYGLLFLLVIPPFQAPDEPNHFYRAYQMSEGRFLAEKRLPAVLDADQREQRAKAGGEIRELIAEGNVEKALRRLYDLKDIGGIGGFLPEDLAVATNSFLRLIHPDNKQDVRRLLSLFRLPLSEENRVFLHFPNTAVYSPVPYLPQAAGIAAGRLLGLPPLVLMYLGRLVNLSAWVLFVYLSIRIVPIGKWLFFLLGLMPMTVYEAASLSADSLTIGVSFLLIAYLLRAAFDAGRDTKLFTIFILSVALALAKQAYLVIPLLFLLIPVEKVSGTKRYYAIFFFLILASVAAVMLWTMEANLHEDLYTIYGFLFPGLSAKGQLLFVISHPLEYVVIAGRTFVENGKYYLDLFVGDDLPEMLRISYIIMLVIAVLSDNQEEIEVSPKKRGIMLVTLLLGVMSVMTLAYVGWTPVAHKTIGGVQGRYFIPLAPLFFLLFYRRKGLFVFGEKRRVLCFVLFSASELSYSLYALIQRYYI